MWYLSILCCGKIAVWYIRSSVSFFFSSTILKELSNCYWIHGFWCSMKNCYRYEMKWINIFLVSVKLFCFCLLVSWLNSTWMRVLCTLLYLYYIKIQWMCMLSEQWLFSLLYKFTLFICLFLIIFHFWDAWMHRYHL